MTDSENPRFTLETENELENAFISSYSLKVKSGEAVLWQTEEQSSTVDNIVYGGRALLPCTVYTVEATVCDNYGNKAEKRRSLKRAFFPVIFCGVDNEAELSRRFRKSPIPLVFKRQFLLSGKVKKRGFIQPRSEFILSRFAEKRFPTTALLPVSRVLKTDFNIRFMTLRRFSKRKTNWFSPLRAVGRSGFWPE